MNIVAELLLGFWWVFYFLLVITGDLDVLGDGPA